MASNFSKMVAGIREEQAAQKDTVQESLDRLRQKSVDQYKIDQLIDKQKKAFAAAHTANGSVYFNLIGKMIKNGEIKPPRGMDERDLQSAYDQAIQLVAKKEFDKSAKKNRANERSA